MKIVVVDHVYLEEQHIERLRAIGEVEFHSELPESDEELKRRIHGAEIVIVGWSHLTKDIIDSDPNLRMISIWATTCHYVDLEAAGQRGIIVTHVPGYATEAVAEYAFALLLAATKKLLQADKHVRDGKFDWRRLKGTELAGKTIGVVGTGAIGCRVAEIAKVFRMHILGFDIQPNIKRAQEIGIQYVDLQTLLKGSDIISLHVTLNPKTEHLIGKRELALMKNGAVLINTSQGRVVDETALVDALSSGKLSCAGLDVFSEEPPPTEGNLLFNLQNIVLSPHVGFHTVEAVGSCTNICIDNVAKFLEDRPQNICALSQLGSSSNS
jgi:phosphoglycerate dehydrogenase-like enzyme